MRTASNNPAILIIGTTGPQESRNQRTTLSEIFAALGDLLTFDEKRQLRDLPPGGDPVTLFIPDSPMAFYAVRIPSAQ